MGTIWVKDFRAGLDTRRLPETTPPGAMLRMYDCHVNKGGEVVQRAVFTKVYESPAGKSIGLGSVPNVGLYIFGQTAGAPSGLPPYMVYQRCQQPDDKVPVLMASFTQYNRKPAVVLRYEDGTAYAYFDGTITSANSPPRVAGSVQPNAVMTATQKLYIVAGTAFHFSGLRTPLLYLGDDGVGAGPGFVDASYEIPIGPVLTGGSLTIDGEGLFFTNDSILRYNLDPDPDNIAFRQVVPGTGTSSGMSILPFGQDHLYVHRTGVRSLRSQEFNRTVVAMDLGSPIDKEVARAYALADDQRRRTMSAVIEPVTGNAWFAVDDQIFVLSYHPLAKITAWSIYRPGFTVDNMAVHNNRVYVRSGDDIYVYGSVTDAYVYSDDVEAEVWTTYFDAGRPMQVKQGRGIDVALRGSWEIAVGYDPEVAMDEAFIPFNVGTDVGGYTPFWVVTDDGYEPYYTTFDGEIRPVEDIVASTVNRSTYSGERVPFEGAFTHASFRFRSLGSRGQFAPAVLSSIGIHHDLDDLED